MRAVLPVLLVCVALLGFGLGAASTRAEVRSPAPTALAGMERKCTPEAECCRICDKGKACGDSCISRKYECHKGEGCACDRVDVCEP
jgi:hypothetical protein